MFAFVWITNLFAQFSLIQQILIEHLQWGICTLLKNTYPSFWTERKHVESVRIFYLVVNTSTKSHMVNDAFPHEEAVTRFIGIRNVTL